MQKFCSYSEPPIFDMSLPLYLNSVACNVFTVHCFKQISGAAKGGPVTWAGIPKHPTPSIIAFIEQAKLYNLETANPMEKGFILCHALYIHCSHS